MSAGFPAGAAVALLFAGPINLPSRLSIARTSSCKIAASVAVMLWLIAIGGGLIAG